MFNQVLMPVGGNLVLSVLVAALPIATVLVALGILRRPAWQASLAGLVAGLLIAVAVWKFPLALALDSVAAGGVFALWPVMWIVFNALLLYNIAVISGRFDAFRDWLLTHLPNDRRVVLVVIGFCFGCLLEGVAGFGVPVAITSALLILIGLPPLEALTVTLIFNTAPVAFGALGTPITVLGQVTDLPAAKLGAMVGRQLPFIALILPFYVMAIYGGLRCVRAIWPVLLVAGASFALAQFVSSNYLDYSLTDVLAALVSLLVTLGFLRVWSPQPDPQYAIQKPAPAAAGAIVVPAWQGWIPWVIVSALVILWTHLKIATIGQQTIHWPGLHNAVFITLYHKAYAANWAFQMLGTGTAILLAAIITAACIGVGPGRFLGAIGATWRQSRLAILTVVLIVGLAYLMNYSGMNYTLGLGVASAGIFFNRGVGPDIDAPAGEPGGQPGVLPLFADRQRKLVIGHYDLRLPGRGIHHVDPVHPGRRQRVGHEAGRVVGVVHDVDLLAVEFVHHVPHPAAHGADAGTLSVDALLMGPDRDLVRCPASRAIATISTAPDAISGTSSANSFLTRPGWVRDRVTEGPR